MRRWKTAIAVCVGGLVVSILADIGYRGSLRATSPRAPSSATGEVHLASYQGAELSLLAIALTTWAYDRRRARER